jgi:dolichyl-phosphate beta-glucosyltransferase
MCKAYQQCSNPHFAHFRRSDTARFNGVCKISRYSPGFCAEKHNSHRDQMYLFLFAVAPIPRRPFSGEKKFRTLSKDGSVTKPEELPCWLDAWEDQKHLGRRTSVLEMERAELFMSVIVPAYNEEERLAGMLEEAVNFLERTYGTSTEASEPEKNTRRRKLNGVTNGHTSTPTLSSSGWEIIIVSDGSADKTEDVAFTFARDHQLSLHPKGHVGPWTPDNHEGVHIPPGCIRVVSLTRNRGKGGAVTHGMRHVRGQYVIFADADGASKFDDLGKLVSICQDIEDSQKRGIAVGSRVHLVGSEAVIKVRRHIHESPSPCIQCPRIITLLT